MSIGIRFRGPSRWTDTPLNCPNQVSIAAHGGLEVCHGITSVVMNMGNWGRPRHPTPRPREAVLGLPLILRRRIQHLVPHVVHRLRFCFFSNYSALLNIHPPSLHNAL